MRKTTSAWGAVAAAAMCCLASASLARGEGRGKSVRLDRRATLAIAYDDNIYLSPTATGSAIGRFDHDLGLSLAGKRSQLRLGYGLTVMRYNENYWVNNLFHQTGTFSAGYEFGDRKRIALEDRFEATTDPASSEEVQRARRNRNDGRLDLDLGLGRVLYLGAEARHVLHYYLRDDMADLLNRKEVTAGPRIGFYVGPRTRLQARMRYQQITYDNILSTRNSTTPSVLVGLNGNVTRRITGRIEAGVFMRSYESTSSTMLTDAMTSPEMDVALEWKGRGETGASLTASRGPREAIFNRFYTGTTIALGFTKQMGRRWKASVLGSYEIDEYPDALFAGAGSEERRDTLTQAGVKVSYRPANAMELRAEYLYRGRDSNLYGFDYADNVLTGGLRVSY